MDTPPFIYAIHGFLGKSTDWQGIFFQNHERINCLDLSSNDAAGSLLEWAERFNREVSLSRGEKILVGYSLGGRLALHALLLNPELWRAAVIISAHTGLKSMEERRKRLLQDEEWAVRFEEESWETLMESWNRQDLFAFDVKPERDEKTFSRKNLAHMLRKWSLGLQEDLADSLHHLNIPILWLRGEHDNIPSDQQNHLRLIHPQSRSVRIPHGGHRVHLQQPARVAAEIAKFISSVSYQSQDIPSDFICGYESVRNKN